MKKILLLSLLTLKFLLAGFNFGECSGSGTFEQQINKFTSFEDAITVGEIPQGIQGLHIELKSDNDVDIRLYAQNGDKIVHWPNGILNGPQKESKKYKNHLVTYSGYNGVDGDKGHEYIEVDGSTPTTFIMKAFGYKAGFATVNYSWSGKDNCSASESGTGHFKQAILQKAINLVGTIPPHIKDVYIQLTSDKDLDIQLYSANGEAIIAWPNGKLSGPNKQSINYHGMKIEWSGYNGVDGNKGHEYIKISGETTQELIMKVYGYQAGYADVDYSWGGQTTADTTPPVITLNGSNPVTLYVGASYKELGAKAIDETDGKVNVTISGSVNTSKVGKYTITYTAVDKAKNIAKKQRVVNVVAKPDTTAPHITLNGGSITLKVGQSYHELGAKAYDNVDGDISNKITIYNGVNTHKAGIYYVKYSVSDKAGNKATAIRKVTVQKVATTIKKTFETRVSDGYDDAEEHSNGHISIGSSDLEMTQEHDKQIVGIRFASVDVPQGATITKAYLQFQVDESSSTGTNLYITTQNSTDAEPFSKDKYNISHRKLLSNSVAWNPPAWNKVGEQSLTQRTDNISAIIQPIINKSSWSNGNPLVFVIKGNGKRVAESYNGDPTAAPLLHIEYTLSSNSNTEAPKITLNGQNDVTILLNSTYHDAGAKAYDDIDGDISDKVVTKNYVNTHKIGTYSVVYSVVDSDGNSATATRVVHVVSGVAKDIFRKAPYLLYTGKNNQMLIMWQLKSKHSASIAWGKTTSYEEGSKSLSEYSSDHLEKALLDNLTPNSKYYYQISIDGKPAFMGGFRTGATSSTKKVSFYIYGDTRSDPKSHDLVAKGVMNEIAKDPSSATFIVSSGDLVSNGESESKWDSEFFDAKYTNLTNMFANLPYLASLGNHAGNGKLFAKYYPYPMYKANRFYYSFDYGPVHFTIIDQFTNYSKGSAQYNWIKNDLASSTKKWKIILLHMPGWSAGGHSNNKDVQNIIQPLCKQYGVSMVVAGHNHYYARAVVDGVQHITTGGGGAPLYDPKSNQPKVVKYEGTYHFIKVRIDNNKFYFKAIRPNGSVIESVTISK